MTTIENNSPSLKKPRVFYGYWIVAVTFLCLFVTSGCGFFCFSLFVKPLQAELGWGRGGIMVAFTLFLLVQGAASPFIGRIIYLFEARKVIAIGALVAGLGFVLLTWVNSLWYFYLSYIIMGIGMTAMGHIPTSTIVSNWFVKWRGTAIGIMSTGIGAGGFAMAPLVGGYLIPNFGLRTTYLVLAVLTWVLIIPLALLVIKRKPADMGLYPDGRQATDTVIAAETSSPGNRGLTLRMALATSGFWLMAVAYFAGGFSSVGIVQNQAPFLDDIGFPIATAAGALGGVGLGSLIGKFVFGSLCDRIQPKYAYAIALSIQAIGILILINIKPASPMVMIWLFVALTGLGAGGWLPTMSMLVSTNFGLATYGLIFGTVNIAQSIGVAAGPLMAGFMFDTMGTYQWAFIIFLSLFAISIPSVLAVRRPKPL